ncbi:E3 ubiquitin-protein ligase TRIM71-like [Mytilus trossulus]|uniref:E3 ubiquitin-protein ligase TRIM71-like n=1 Tax=Mytilus trossulus TaxID=6551 RepID=UPI003006E9EA
MASKMAMCDPCSRLNKSSEGIRVCTDCEDVLCTDCVAIHSAVKILATHHLVDLSVSAENEFHIKRDCSDHEGMYFEFYCSDHDCLICRTCMANTHRTCGKIQPIDVAAKGCKSSAMVEDITKEITSLLKATKELVVDRQENKTRVGEIKAKILKQTAKIRQDINGHLDQLEKKLIFEVETLDKTIREKACYDLGEADKRQNDIKDMWQKVVFFTKHGSESQLFIHLNTIKPDVSKQAQSFQYLMSCLESNDMDFEATDFISVIKSFGSVKIKSSSCTVAYQPPKHLQAQTREIFSKVPSTFELEKKVEIPAGRITGMVVTNDNKLILCKDGIDGNNVSMWTETGQHIKSCTADGRPFGIAIVPGTNEGVVTLSNAKSIQFINLTTVTTGRLIAIDVSCPNGVAVIRDSVYVGSNDGKVSIINLTSGKCQKTLKIGRTFITAVIAFVKDRDERLYCCEYGGANLVSCIKLDGTRVFSCPVYGPMTLALDSKGSLYVTGYDSNDLHRISPDGKVDDIILKNSDGLNQPLAVAFNNTYTRLYISNAGAKNVMIFNCK